MSRPSPHCEQGFNLIELMVVTALLLVVGGIVTTGVLSAHGVTRHADARVEALTTIHQAAARVGREIRAADSRDTTVPSAALRAASPAGLETDVFRGDPQRRIRFTYTVTGGELIERRRTWAPGADAVAAPETDVTTTLLTGLVTDGGQPLFAYHAADGACLTGCADPSGAYVGTALPAADLERVSEVHLQVRRSIGDDQSPIEVVTRVTLRNA